MTIEVFLDKNANPPVTVNPKIKDKDKGKGTITWKLGKDQDFTFVSLDIANNPSCFSNKDVKDHKITIDDDNKDGAAAGDYPYAIVVSQGGANYGSKPSTKPGDTENEVIIRNKP